MSSPPDSGPVFSVRIVTLDYYMSPPVPGLDFCYSSFQGRDVDEVPVIRIYGSTPAGQKTCLHIHRALPYLYIPCSDVPLNRPEEGHAYIHVLAGAVEKALRYRSASSSRRQHVHGCCFVRAKKLYGFHFAEELFVKIYLYNPGDIARAATLFLDGAILSKSFQPYESHIPYILQFLVDYNLYGMGHVHLSKFMFRSPLPDIFEPRVAMFKKGVETNDVSVDIQVEVSTALGVSPVWISSRVPSALIWPLSDARLDNFKHKTMKLLRRQSVCELEVDSSVDDILNVRDKMHTSLSQTETDVKLVQSLVPIWEEFERSSAVETESRDISKPLPESVLRNFLHGFDYEKSLYELCKEIQISSPSRSDPVEVSEQLDRYISSVLKIEKPHGLVESLSPHSQLFTCSEEKRSAVLPSESSYEHAGKFHSVTELPILGSATGNLSLSEGPETGNTKNLDNDAYSLLCWLASSQAEEDLNPDGVLVHEGILSPLFSTTSYKEALEIAHLDYENSSQQECQDILDSIGDVLKYEGQKDEATEKQNDHTVEFSAGFMIPQVDGSSDDVFLTPQEGEFPLKSRTSEEDNGCACPGTKCTGAHCKFQNNSPSWGSLPLCIKQKNCPDVEYTSDYYCYDDLKDKNYPNKSLPNEGHKRYGPSTAYSAQASFDNKEGKIILSCSVRDLMRKKRSFRTEQCESECRSIKKSSYMQMDKTGTSTFGTPVLYPSSSDIKVKMPDESCDSEGRESSSDHQLLTSQDGCVESCTPTTCCCRDHKNSGKYIFKEIQVTEGLQQEKRVVDFPNLSSVKISEACSVCLPGKYSPILEKCCLDEDVLQDHDENEGCSMNTASFEPQNGVKPDIYSEKASIESIQMSFCQKPPEKEKFETILEDSVCPSAFITGCLDRSLTSASFVRTEEHGVDLPDFFSEEVDGENSHTFLPIEDDLFQEFALGLPTHFQNDGSFLYLLTHASSPPTSESIQQWLSEVVMEKPSDYTPRMDQCDDGVQQTIDWQETSQISCPDGKSHLTPISQIGFRDPASLGAGQQLTFLSIEILTESRGDLRPDPQFDAIKVIALAVQQDVDDSFGVNVLVCCDDVEKSMRFSKGISCCKFIFVSEEKHLFDHFVQIISSFDPDILMGWEIQNASLGFLADRAAYFGLCLLTSISRTPTYESGVKDFSVPATVSGVPNNLLSEGFICNAAPKDETIADELGRLHASGIHVGGRIILNIWRVMRAEVKLNMYTVEAVADEVLRRKVPSIPCIVLNNWFSSGTTRAMFYCIQYIINRAKLNLEILNHLDLVNRTSELARVFGIDFFSVLSRGSQFRVESMLMRLSHTLNYLAISPGYQQVASQPAMECLPLVMEPESAFYYDPVVVLDFQSLYPSMIIAYNLCFSTCLGKISSMAGVLGVSTYSPDPNLMDFKEQILLTPNRVLFVPAKIRQGVLPRLLDEILSTRIMVKKALKRLVPSQRVLQRIFNARQLALKLIANVTYGYTAAGFSGRMPCAELADSIVQCGRVTLETTIAYVNKHDKWKARVVYGDTDSLFVLLKGRSIEEAFKIGNEIASAITSMNPYPVTLKMEKVYHPCFLLTKKRYVGYSYESPNQKKPTFDAKGIETVRRDTCPAVAKTLEQSIRIVFETFDMSKVKSYLQRQWMRILSGKVPLQNFIFAKEVHLGTYSSRASLPPAAIVATKTMRLDYRAKPQYGERVPYVVVHGEPGARLVDMVVEPLELLDIASPYRLNDLYYINKQIIPALQRVFGLLGANLKKWFLEIPRPVRSTSTKSNTYESYSESFLQSEDNCNDGSRRAHVKRSRIDTYYTSRHCILCGELTQASPYLCDQCSENGPVVVSAVVGRTSKLEKDIQHLTSICQHCGGGDCIIESGIKCTSLACPVFYERRKIQKDLRALSCFAAGKGFYPCCMTEWF